MDSSDRRNRFLQQMHRNTMFRLQDYPGRHYNFSFSGERDIVSHTELPAANYEGAHQNLIDSTLVNYTKDEYVRDENGNIITCGGWKELCLRSTNPLLWAKSSGFSIAASSVDNVGVFQNAGKITDAGQLYDGYTLWASAASGAPTGIMLYTIWYKAGTSSSIRLLFVDGALQSNYYGVIGSAAVVNQNAGALTLISDEVDSRFNCRKVKLLMNWTNKANSLYVVIGPFSNTGKTIIVLGASVAGAVGTGDITTERPFTETTGSVITWSSLSADLTNGRGPRITYASAPKLLEALQGTGTDAQGQIEWTGTPSGLPASASGIIATNTTNNLLQIEADGSVTVSDGSNSTALVGAMSANTKATIKLAYQPYKAQVESGELIQPIGFKGNWSVGTVFGIGPGSAYMVHESIKIFKRPRLPWSTREHFFDVINSQTVSGVVQATSGQSVTIYWGDGTSNTYTGTTDPTGQAYSKNYGSAGNRAVTIVNKSSLTIFTMTTTGANIKLDLSSLPSVMTRFHCSGSNTITGNLSSVPSVMTLFYCTGSTTITGNLSSIPSVMTYFTCTGSNTISDYTTRVWPSNMQRVYLVPVGAGGLSSAEVDQLLIDLALAGGTWSGDKQVYLKGTNAIRTAASDAAVATLQGKSVSVTTN